MKTDDSRPLQILMPFHKQCLSVHARVQAVQQVTSSQCPTRTPTSLRTGLGKCCPCSSSRATAISLRWGLSPSHACTQCFVTLLHCWDRWLSNNARFKCKPKGTFDDFFFLNNHFFFKCMESLVSSAFCMSWFVNICAWALHHSTRRFCCKPGFCTERLVWR